MPKKPRILFFDTLRTLCVALIVYTHFKLFVCPEVDVFNYFFFSAGSLPGGLYPRSIALLAVYGMIFVSGAVLEYNYEAVRSWADYRWFLLKRFIRLYPIYWVSLIFGFLLILWAAPTIGPYMSGQKNNIFLMVLGLGSNSINEMGWFIGTIFLLYLLFPVLSAAIRKSPHLTILILMGITFGFRIVAGSGIFLDWWRTIPLNNLFEFGLGIYCIRQGFYPKTASNPLVSKTADFTFYVFLFHLPIVLYFGPSYLTYHISALSASINPVVVIGLAVAQNPILNYIVILAEILIISAIAMIVDERIQKIIRGRVLTQNLYLTKNPVEK